MHFHLLVPVGVFVDDDDRLAFALPPVPTSADVLPLLDRIVRRLADETRDDSVDEGVEPSRTALQLEISQPTTDRVRGRA